MFDTGPNASASGFNSAIRILNILYMASLSASKSRPLQLISTLYIIIASINCSIWVSSHLEFLRFCDDAPVELEASSLSAILNMTIGYCACGKKDLFPCLGGKSVHMRKYFFA